MCLEIGLKLAKTKGSAFLFKRDCMPHMFEGGWNTSRAKTPISKKQNKRLN